MSSLETGNLIYLVLLGAVLLSWFFVSNRQSLTKTAQQAAAWGLIFLGVIAAIGLWDDIRQTVRPTQTVFSDQGYITVPRGNDGHYHLTVKVNGQNIPFIVDTGASSVVLTLKDAARIGLNDDDLIFYSSANTANGSVKTAPVTLDTVTLGSTTDTNIRAFVNQGEMRQSLLGMSYLNLYQKIEISGGNLILYR